MDPYRYLDFLTRRVMRSWAEREQPPDQTVWQPLSKALSECRVALLSTAGIAYPVGLSFGLPGDADGQRNVLRAALESAAAMDQPRSYHELPFQWPESRSQAIRHANPPPPIAQLLKRQPWLLTRLISGRLP